MQQTKCTSSDKKAEQRRNRMVHLAGSADAACSSVLQIFKWAALIALLAVAALAQSSNPVQSPDQGPLPNSLVERYCNGLQLYSGPEFDEVQTIVRRLAIASPRVQVAFAYSPFVDAWEVEAPRDIALICVPIALVHHMGSQGELAFIIAHEFGHALDDTCKSLEGRARVADRSGTGKALSFLFGHSRGNEATSQRACESRSDELGLSFITRAGYDPLDAPAALGRLAKYSGKSGAGPWAHIAVLGKDHPIMADRIRHLRKLIADQSKSSHP